MSDAFDQMKNLKNGNYTEVEPQKTQENSFLPNNAQPGEGNIKSFILKYGRKIVDFNTALGFCVAILSFIIILIGLIGSLSNTSYYDNDSNRYGLILLFVVPLTILLIVIISNYFMYLLIDIKESLNKIEKNTRNN